MIFIKLSFAFSLLSAFAQDVGVEGENAEYNKKLQSISTSLTKVKDSKFALKELIKAMQSKKAILDEEGKDVTIERIMSTHKDLKEQTVEYNKKYTELKYKYPEKGELNERKYMPIRVQTLEEIEEEIGIDGVLTRLKRKVEKKYRAFDPKDEEDGGQNSLLRRKAQLKAQEREKKKKKLVLER